MTVEKEEKRSKTGAGQLIKLSNLEANILNHRTAGFPLIKSSLAS